MIQHFGEVSANQMMLDTVVALAADIQTKDGKSMSTVDKLGNIQYALHRALVDNRNFIQQDSLQAGRLTAESGESRGLAKRRILLELQLGQA